MRQAVMTAPGTIELRDISEPEAGPGEVLLRIRGSVFAEATFTSTTANIRLRPIRWSKGMSFLRSWKRWARASSPSR